MKNSNNIKKKSLITITIVTIFFILLLTFIYINNINSTYNQKNTIKTELKEDIKKLSKEEINAFIESTKNNRLFIRKTYGIIDYISNAKENVWIEKIPMQGVDKEYVNIRKNIGTIDNEIQIVADFYQVKNQEVYENLTVLYFYGTYEEAIQWANNVEYTTIPSLKGLKYREISIDNLDQQLQKKQAEEQREQKIQEVCGELDENIGWFLNWRKNKYAVFNKTVTLEEFSQCLPIFENATLKTSITDLREGDNKGKSIQYQELFEQTKQP